MNKIITTIVNFKKVLSLLALTLSFSATAQNTCAAAFTYTVGTNGQVSFTNASAGTTTNTAYSWNWSGSSGWGNSTQQSPTFTFTYNGTYYVYLSITDSLANCQSYATDSVVITNAQACQVSFTYTVGSNGQVSFTNTSVGNVSYYWNFGDGNTSTLTSPQNTYLYNGTYTAYIWADTTGGYCGGYAQVTIVISNATPCSIATSYTTNNTGNGLVIFTDTVTTNPPSTLHYWYVNGNFAGSGNPFTYQFNSNGTFSVCDFAQDSSFLGGSCADSTCTSVTVSGMTCNDSAFFYMYQDSNAISTWDVYLYSINNNYPINAVWNWGDGTSSTGLYPSHVYQIAGWYNICVTAYFACGDSSTYCQNDSVYRMTYSASSSMVYVNVINNSNGIKTNANMTSLKAYPNPFNEDLTINFASYENKKLTYTLFDMMGNQIIKESVEVVKGDNEFKINTNGIGHGVYFINLTGTDGRKASTIKVIK